MANLAVVNGSTQFESGTLSIQTVDDLARISKMMAASGFFADCRDAAQAGVKILAGAELGFPAFASLTGISIIKGKPVMGASLQSAAVKRSGKYNYKVAAHTTDRCSIEFFERFDKWESIGVSEFTMDDAKSAGLVGGDNWRKYPKNMLFARAISNGVRWFCPDLFLGAPVYTPDEMGLAVDESGDALDVEVITETSRQEPSPASVPLFDPIERLSAIRQLTGHNKSQVKSIAASKCKLNTQNAPSWTEGDCDRFRDALFVDVASKYDVWRHDNHKEAAYLKLLTSATASGPLSDQEIFELWKNDCEARVRAKAAEQELEQAESVESIELETEEVF